MPKEELAQTKRVYEGKILNFRVDTMRFKKGDHTVQATREVVEHSPAVVIVPVDDKGNVLLVRQYRHAVGQELLEAPAGGHAVLRELQEETGFTADEVIPMRSFWMSPGFSKEEMHSFIARKLRPGALHQEDDENIEVVPTPLADIPNLIKSGAIHDSKTVAALLIAIHVYGLQS